MKKIQGYLRKNKAFVVLFVVVFLIHLVFITGFHETWWDSGVYLGMGKYLFSGGSAGLWEHIRPPLLPVLLGLVWFIGLPVQISGMVLELLFCLGAIFFFYEVIKFYFKEKVALIASAIFSFSSILFFLSFHLYTEVPAVFFVLLGIYLFVKKKYYFAGAACALAFLAKFPAGMFFGILLLVLLLNKEFKNSLKLSAGFVIPLAPVLIAYAWVYSNPLLPFIEARHAISQVLGCNVLRFKPWWQYFSWIYSESILHLFAFIGLIAYFSDFRKKNLLPLLCLAVPFVYFSQMHCRDYRYLAVFIPFVSVFSALGIVYLITLLKKYPKQIFTIVLLLVLGFSVFKGVLFYIGNENINTNPAAEVYFSYLKDKDISGEIWTSNPTISFYTDASLNKMYYPVYDGEVSTDFYNYLSTNSESIEYVLLDNCGGGIICAPDDSVCEEKNKQMIDFLDENFSKVYDETYGQCFYKIYKN
ncbi:glycosyltransferase family 39 protein [Candidatus Woesearchaeota archaeon]|nr:glycosyltransferase family 39 protein [Candidatus Woesearchaeota archaeon]MBW3006152.1 glycosyltransferase family 39 protein [Candidatus Woesearchaeota archaeon]